MRPGRRITAGAATASMLLGFLCPTICLADEAASSDRSGHAVDGPVSCHDAEPPEPARGGSEPRSEHSDCAHCASTASYAPSDSFMDNPDIGVLSAWLPTESGTRVLIGRVSARAHDPPPRYLLLLKNSFLL